MTTMRPGGLVLAVILGALALGLAVGRAEEERLAPALDLAGPATCAECHPDVHEAWSRSTHARTLLPATPENLPHVMAAGGRILHPPGESVFRREGDRVFVTTMGPDGLPVEYPLDFVLGARRVRMFVTTLPNGRRQVLPFMLDEPNERYFDYTDLMFGAGGDPNRAPVVRPGEPSFWTGYQRYFDARCGGCHTTGFAFAGPDRPEGEPDSRWSHAGVTCESCHGPAAQHARYWNDEVVLPDDPILSMGGLSPAAVQDLCLSCHTEAEPSAPGFRPGDDFLEFYDPTLLDDEERLDPTGRPVELVYDGVPFSVSRCAIEGRLTCLSCHDPHGGPYRAQLTAPPGSDALCADCHEDLVAGAAAHSRHDPKLPGGRCTDCHMPFLTVERGHGVVTDHSISVPNPEFAGPGIARDACTWCHGAERGAPGGVVRIDDERVRAAFAKWWPGTRVRPEWATVLLRARRGEEDAVEDLASVALDAKLPATVRASAAALLGRFPAASEATLDRLSRDESSLVRGRAAQSLGGIFTESADSVLLRLLFDDADAVRYRAAAAALRGWERVRRNPSLLEPVLFALRDRTEAFPQDDRAWFLLGATCQIAGDVPGAIRAWEAKLRLDPYAVLVRRALENLKQR